VAILGLGAITKRAVVIDDAIAIRPMMWLSLTFDHRATDGMQAFRFLESLRRRLESVT
jgi:pyruvate/2-oxoglutarate dehydrogenase complex dihydrolipoamide acyltransferase (E2) component